MADGKKCGSQEAYGLAIALAVASTAFVVAAIGAEEGWLVGLLSAAGMCLVWAVVFGKVGDKVREREESDAG